MGYSLPFKEVLKRRGLKIEIAQHCADMWLQLWAGSAILYCLLLTFIFVGSLYIWGKESISLSRDNPQQIKRRIFSVTLATVISFWRLIGITAHKLIPAVLWPFLATATLFAGPLLQMVLDREEEFNTTLQTIRNLVAGPITEEVVFRACMCPILLAGGFSADKTILFVPLFFGIAHLHHLLQHIGKSQSDLRRAIISTSIFIVHLLKEWNLIQVAVQLGFTTIFGILSSYIFVRTGHILPVIIQHCFCNYMGLPRFDDALSHPQKYAVVATYVLGLVGFFVLLPIATDPKYYESILYYYNNTK